MTVEDVIKRLKKMPQEEECGFRDHDMNLGDSSSIFGVEHLTDDECENDSGKIDHPVVIYG
jgi:hypothetical protein